jgi:hypothetical protein
MRLKAVDLCAEEIPRHTDIQPTHQGLTALFLPYTSQQAKWWNQSLASRAGL